MIRVERTGDVATITLDRPERRNALDADALEGFYDAVAAADEPVLYLTGAGPAFCAGADLDTVDGLDGDTAGDFAARGQAVADALANYDGAVVAGVDGPARGGGLDLALACDVRVCTPDATFGAPGVELGLFGAWGGTARLPAVVGPGLAADLTLTGRTIDAETARRVGLVSQMRADPRAVADRIAEHDAATVREVVGLLRDRAGGERARRAFARLARKRNG